MNRTGGNPSISVVIATYNRRDLLARTLPTVLAQDLATEDYEVIVVVDGATDGTAPYLHGLESPRHLVVLEQTNQGPAAARNAGAARARGEYLLFLDDDIRCRSDLLRRHLEGQDRRSDRVCMGPIHTARESPASLATAWTMTSSLKANRDLLAGVVPPSKWLPLDPNSSLARSMFTHVGGFDPAFRASENREISQRLLRAGAEFHVLPQAAVDQVFVKSTLQLARDDAVAYGRCEVRMCRKHPVHRAVSALARISEGSWLRRKLRKMAATTPLAGSGLDALLVALEAGSSLGSIASAGERIVKVRQGVAYWQGARQEAATWQALEQEFGVRLPVLIYHRVGPPQPGTYPELTVSPRRFERHLRWLAAWGYQGITASDWAAWRMGERKLPHRPVLLTFDDAYADIAKHALPLLERYRYRGTLFVVSGLIGGTNRWDETLGSGTLRLMDRDDLAQAAALGIEIASHGMSHADLSRLDGRSAWAEVAESKGQLAKLGIPLPRSFAYAYGYLSADALRAAKANYDIAFTTAEGMNTLATPSHLLRRTMVLPDDTRLDFACRLRFGYSPRRRLIARAAAIRRAALPKAA